MGGVEYERQGLSWWAETGKLYVLACLFIYSKNFFLGQISWIFVSFYVIFRICGFA